MSKYSLRPRAKFVSTLLVVVGVVLVWRGLWNLMDIYFFPGKPVLSNILSVLIGVLIFYLPDRDLSELV